MCRQISKDEYDGRKAREEIKKRDYHWWRQDVGTADGERRVMSESIWGVKHCKCCDCYWNRDKAAAMNILALYASGKRPARFTPTGIDQEILICKIYSHTRVHTNKHT